MADGMEKVSIAWHPAFCSAAEFDLRTEKENLHFESEHNLSKEPLRMDLLIIKKNTEEVSKNDIAKLFRKFNIIEYKSPGDSLTIDDFYKTLGYACLYKGLAGAVNSVPAQELTVSVFREQYPEKLVEMLKADGATIVQTAPGVYEVRDAGFFPAQIIATSQLAPIKHAGLKILSREAREEDIEIFLEEAQKETSPGERLNIDAILQVSVSANRQTFDNLKRRNSDMCEALRSLMKDEIAEEVEKGKMEQAKETAFNLSKMGMEIPAIAKAVNVAEDIVKKWFDVQPA